MGDTGGIRHGAGDGRGHSRAGGGGSERPHPHDDGGGGGRPHGHSHGHGHSHAGDGSFERNHPQHKKARDRIARALGHLQSVARMIDDEADCMDVLVQISAVRSALNGAARLILDDHVRHCLLDAARDGDVEAIERLNHAIGRFMDLK